MIRAKWTVGPDERRGAAPSEVVTIDVDDPAQRDMAIELFTASVDRELGIARRARELARENS